MVCISQPEMQTNGKIISFVKIEKVVFVCFVSASF